MPDSQTQEDESDDTRSLSTGATGRFLGAALTVARSPRRGEYLLVHFASGTLLRTDRLGAVAVRALIQGRTDIDVVSWVERMEPGAGTRVRHLIKALSDWRAMTADRPMRSTRSLWLRRVATGAAGVGLTISRSVVRHVPDAVLAKALLNWPPRAVADHAWRSSRLRVLANLDHSVYAERPISWRDQVGRQCVLEPARMHLFHYLSLAIGRQRLGDVLELVFVAESVNSLVRTLDVNGPVVAAFLHTSMSPAVPNLLRARDHSIVRVVDPVTHGVNVSERSGPLSEFFDEAPDLTVEEDDPNASVALLRHLKAGRSVYVALDKAGRSPRRNRVPMLGHWLARNDGPAWLCVRSGRPLVLLTTYRTSSGVVISASPLLKPDPSLPADRRVAVLSQRLYEHAEAAIDQHPEAWPCWASLGMLKAEHP